MVATLGRRMAAASVSIIASAALVLAQAPPRPPRIMIATRPAPGQLSRPPAPAAKTVVAGYDVVSWIDRTEAADALQPAPAGTILLGRDLALTNKQYSLDTATLVVVADSLTFNGNTTIDLSSRRPGAPAGTLVLLAKKITCAPGAAVRVVSNGAQAISRQGGGPGGNLVVSGATDQNGAAKLPSCIALAAPGGPARDMEVRDHRGGQIVITHETLPKGPDGTVKLYPDFRAATENDPLARLAWSAWTIERLETLRIAIYEASRTRDDARMLELFRDYEGLTLPADAIDANQRDRYLAVLADLNHYRETALAPLFVEELTVQPGGLPQRVSVFTEGATLKSYLAPTHALAVRASVEGKRVLGLLEYRPEHPDELAIEIEWELSVDPWVQQLAAAELAKDGRHLDGVFADWSLEAKPMQDIGIRSSTATLLPGGRDLRVRLVADADRANVVFWRLLNSAGLPWSVDWKFTEPRTGRVVTGTWAGPPLTLVRQQQPAVIVSQNEMTNTGASPATVNYLRAADGTFVVLSPAIHLDPGGKAPLPSSAGSGSVTAAIPPEAVETGFDPAHFGSDFYVLNGDQAVDQVVVRNSLPPADDARGPFDYVEVTLTSRVGGSEGDAATAGPFRLSTSGTHGAEISIPFLRLARGAREVTLSGRAYYAGGSYRTLKPTTFNTTVIAVTSDLLQ